MIYKFKKITKDFITLQLMCKMVCLLYFEENFDNFIFFFSFIQLGRSIFPESAKKSSTEFSDFSSWMIIWDSVVFAKLNLKSTSISVEAELVLFTFEPATHSHPQTRKNSSPTCIPAFASKTYYETQRDFNWKIYFHGIQLVTIAHLECLNQNHTVSHFFIMAVGKFLYAYF